MKGNYQKHNQHKVGLVRNVMCICVKIEVYNWQNSPM